MRTYIGVLEDEEELIEGVHRLQDRHDDICRTGAVLEDWVVFRQVQDLLAKVEASVDQVTQAENYTETEIL